MTKRRIALCAGLFLAAALGGVLFLAARPRVQPRVAQVQISEAPAQGDPGAGGASPGSLAVTGLLELRNPRSRPAKVDLSGTELLNGGKAGRCVLTSVGAAPAPPGRSVEIAGRGEATLRFSGSVQGPPRRLLLRAGALGELPLETVSSGASRFEVAMLQAPEVEKGAFPTANGALDVVVFEIAIRNNSSCAWAFDPTAAMGASDENRARYSPLRETPENSGVVLGAGRRRELELLYVTAGAGADPYPWFQGALEGARVSAPPATSAEVSPAEDPTPDFPRIDATPGPVYVFAQHQAAYYVIKKLQLRGDLPWRGNVLINFDSHSDAWLPARVVNPQDRDRALAFLHDPGLSPAEKTERLRAFVTHKLNVGTWIIPLMDDGSLAAYTWVPPRVSPLDLVEKQVAVMELRRRFADVPRMAPQLRAPRLPPGFAFDVMHDDGLAARRDLAGKPGIVTFDMDYFSCRWGASDQGRRVWVPVPTSAQIRASVASAVAGLKRSGVRPKVILIAESPGFAPRAQAPLIAEALMAELRKAGLAR